MHATSVVASTLEGEMLTVTKLTRAMKDSGRHLTGRTARSWWSNGILPPPERAGQGQGGGTVTYWPCNGVLLQAQIAHDLMRKRFGIQKTTAGLWLLGFPVPFEAARAAFESQIAEYHRRARGRAYDEVAGLDKAVSRIVTLAAEARGGFSGDEEGLALYGLTIDLLELLCGVGDGIPRDRLWAEDTAAELLLQIKVLAPLQARYGRVLKVPAMPVKDLADALMWISNMASVRRQGEAVAKACAHDWVRARRIARLVLGLIDRADAKASPDQHFENRSLLTWIFVVYGFVLFPIVLAIVRDAKERRRFTQTIFAATARVRLGPARVQKAISVAD